MSIQILEQHNWDLPVSPVLIVCVCVRSYVRQRLAIERCSSFLHGFPLLTLVSISSLSLSGFLYLVCKVVSVQNERIGLIPMN